MKTWIYSWIVYPLVFLLAKIYSLFNNKVNRTLELRSWKNFIGLRLQASKPIRYWVHVASSGELEYAIPIIQHLSAKGVQVMVTYYSISARVPVEKLAEKYNNVCLVVPLPHDGLGLMKEFVRLAKQQGVSCILLMKYELWPGLLWECRQNDIKIALVDALRPSRFHNLLLHKIDAILFGYESEAYGVQHHSISVIGDTRVDQVRNRLRDSRLVIEKYMSKDLLKLLETKSCFVAGSVWPEDIKILAPALSILKKNSVNLCIAPHEMHESFVVEVQKVCQRAGYKTIIVRGPLNAADHKTERSEQTQDSSVAVIIACKGILVETYSLCQLAYVGGGFGDGLHSVWEPALAGADVSCGTNRKRSPESYELERHGILTEVKTSEEFIGWIARSLRNDQTLRNDRVKRIDYHYGAAQRAIEYLEQRLSYEKQ
jgi:3-deoxy-D-manno-octulosonic-acid transferase